MKELSIEEKARAYDEARKKIAIRFGSNVADEIFSEYEESEDERIREWLIRLIKATCDYDSPTSRKEVDDALAWLEKQGEQKPVDKVEPKFHEGDWVVSPNGVYWHIDKISNNRYEVTSNTGESSNWQLDTNIYHKFTIQDAKDGDVLFTSSTASHETFIFKNIDEKGNAKCYFAYDSEDGFREGKYHFIGRATDCKPATKEQHDLLFQKMKEAGYEWDAEKKELKKIEQKPAWSEEDEAFLDDILCKVESNLLLNKDEKNWLKSIKDRVQPQNKWKESLATADLENSLCHIQSGFPDTSYEYRILGEAIEFIRCTEPKSQWTPSEGQMKLLREVQQALLGKDCHNRFVNFMYELKRLREE